MSTTPPLPPRGMPIAPLVSPEPRDDHPPPPPALSATALRDELREASRRRAEELKALTAERARLEKLSADLAAARAALLGETALLERKLKEAPAGAKCAAPPAAPPLPPTPARRPAPDAKARQVALARALKGMKPDQAASLLVRLDRPLAVEMLRRMRPADAGAVLEKMKVETAAELFAAMAAPADGAEP